MLTSFPSRRTIGELKFPRKLFAHDLRYLLLFDGQTGLTNRLNDRSKQQNPSAPTFIGTPVWDVSRYGHHLHCEPTATGSINPHLGDSVGWIQGFAEVTVACLVRPLVTNNVIWSDRLGLTGDLQGVLRLNVIAGTWQALKNDAATSVGVAATADAVGDWSLVVVDSGRLGTRLYVNGALGGLDASTAALATLSSPTEVFLNREFTTVNVLGDNEYQLFAIWKRQIGPIVNYHLRHLLRAA